MRYMPPRHEEQHDNGTWLKNQVADRECFSTFPGAVVRLSALLTDNWVITFLSPDLEDAAATTLKQLGCC